MLILVLAANTSFADFPRLASFHAARPLPARRRSPSAAGGSCSPTASSCWRRWRRCSRSRSGPSVDAPHPALRDRRVHVVHAVAGWHGEAPPHPQRNRAGSRGLWVNGIGAVATGVVGVVIAVTKFTHGAWIIMIDRARSPWRCSCGSTSTTTTSPRSSTSPIPTLAVAHAEAARRGRAGVAGRRRPRPGDALRRPPRRRPRAGGARGARGPQPRRRVLGPLRLQARVRARRSAGWCKTARALVQSERRGARRPPAARSWCRRPSRRHGCATCCATTTRSGSRPGCSSSGASWW